MKNTIIRKKALGASRIFRYAPNAPGLLVGTSLKGYPILSKNIPTPFKISDTGDTSLYLLSFE